MEPDELDPTNLDGRVTMSQADFDDLHRQVKNFKETAIKQAQLAEAYRQQLNAIILILKSPVG